MRLRWKCPWGRQDNREWLCLDSRVPFGAFIMLALHQTCTARALALLAVAGIAACTTTTRRIRVDADPESTVRMSYLGDDHPAPEPQLTPAEFEVTHRARGAAVIGLMLGAIVLAAGSQLYIASLDSPADPTLPDDDGLEEAAGITLMGIGGTALLASIVGLAIPVKKTRVRFDATPTQPGYASQDVTLAYPGAPSNVEIQLDALPDPGPPVPVPVPVPVPTSTAAPSQPEPTETATTGPG